MFTIFTGRSFNTCDMLKCHSSTFPNFEHNQLQQNLFERAERIYRIYHEHERLRWLIPLKDDRLAK